MNTKIHSYWLIVTTSSQYLTAKRNATLVKAVNVGRKEPNAVNGL